jgi:glycosyltransferase involved in cell wall biosynthesis
MLEVILYILYAVLLAVFGCAVWRLRLAFGRFTMKTLLTDKKTIDSMPSVSVCIPARNERHAMTDSLQRVIESRYPKLEIIVHDDVSGDGTSALIKAFAHEGVRFIEGERLPDGWVGKNHALQSLLEQASGTYVLFMDVDTRVTPDSIEQLVAYMQHENAAMVSVLPRREDGLRASVLFSSLRYFWEIMFHRRSLPATASNAWMVHRQTLADELQGFSRFKDAVQPESRISAELMATGRYRFLMGTALLGISYEKKWRSQLSTSVRLLYPLLGAKIEHSVIAALDLLIISSPLVIIVSGLITGWSYHQIIAGGIYALYVGLYQVYLAKLWNRGAILGGLLWGIIVIQEAALIIASAIAYKRNRVTWKGRHVKAPRD